MLNNYPDVLNIKQAADALGVSTASIYQLVNNRIIGSRRVGRKILIPKVCLIDYLNSARYIVSQQQ